MFQANENVLVIEVPAVLSHAFADTVEEKLSALGENQRVVVFVGASEEVFSLGMDLETFVREKQDPREAVQAIGAALVAIQRCPRPTLGIARGRAVGGGVGMLAACDFVLASPSATFGLPELLWGFVPAAIWPVVTARIGPARARAWAMTAFARGAEEARLAGLVDELAGPQGIEAAARRAVRQLARVDPRAIRLLRTWSAEAPSLPIEVAIRKGTELSASQLADPRVLAKLEAYFVEGEPPWGGAP